MKAGRTLTQLAMEIERQATAKQDFVAPVTKMKMDDHARLQLLGGDRGDVSRALQPIAHAQLAEYVGIPKAYYDRMLATPDLLAANVNKWLPAVTKSVKNQQADRRMVRTLDGEVRAILSDGYRSLENHDLAEAVLPMLLERDMVIASCELTTRKLYIKAYDRRLERDVPTGAKMGQGHVIFDTWSPAIIIANSEVGFGRLVIEHGVYTRQCTNLASFGPAFKRTHIGGRAEESDEVYAMLSDKTKQIQDAAIWSKVRDVVKSALDAAYFEEKIKAGVEAGQRTFEKAPVESVIEVVSKRLGILEGERKGILAHLIEGASLTQYGLHAAITRASQDVDSYDRASELERMGGEVIELAANDWQRIIEEAA